MKLLIFVFAILTFASCSKNQGTTTGDPFIGFTFTASSQARTVAKHFLDQLLVLTIGRSYASPPPGNLIDSANNIVTIGTFWISVEKIEFKANEVADSNEVDGSQVEFQGPYQIDLLATPGSTLASGNIQVSDFHRLKYHTTTAGTLDSGAPSGLLNKTIYMSGTVNGNPFIFAPSNQVEISTAGSKLLSAKALDNILLQFNTANFFRKIDLTTVGTGGLITIHEGNVVSSTGACPLIDASANDLYNCFIQGLSTESNVGRDSNGDAQLESGEESIK